MQTSTILGITAWFSISMAWGCGIQIVQANDALQEQIKIMKRHGRTESVTKKEIEISSPLNSPVGSPRSPSAKDARNKGKDNSGLDNQPSTTNRIASYCDRVIADLRAHNKPPQVFGIPIR